MRAAARTIAMVCGTTMSPPPVMSRTPSSDWVVGSWIGVAAQLQRWTDRRKCSAPMMLAGWSRARAMPGALVPASRSSQLLPSTKPMDSARRSMLGVPHTHSSCPAASETAITASQSRAACPRTSSRRGKTWARGWASRWSRRASSISVMGASTRSASTPAAAERTHESATWARTVASGSIEPACASRAGRSRGVSHRRLTGRRAGAGWGPPRGCPRRRAVDSLVARDSSEQTEDRWTRAAPPLS